MSAEERRPDPVLHPGETLGHYEIVSFLGAGGMGEIYVARDARLQRLVAVKILPAHYGLDQERLRRFEQEARAASRLSHPNIVSIYDVGETDHGLPYIVTELLEGETLGALLRRGRLQVAKAIRLAAQIIRAIAAAHEKGIIHRDLKPSNIFVTNDGHVKLLDFGLAKLTQSEWKKAAGDEETLSGLSTPGAVLGSAGYMSPEQVRGAVVGPASDIFSFGVVFYEMLTGRRAFQRESAVETMNSILTDQPEPIDASGIPPVIVAVVLRCLEKRPEDRFASARDVAFSIENLAAPRSFTDSLPVRILSGAANTVGNRPRLSIGVVGLALVTLLGILWAMGTESASSSDEIAPSSRLPFTQARLEKVTSRGVLEDVAISSDGNFLAYAGGARGGMMSLRLRHLPSESDIELIPPRQGQYLRTAGFSANGNFIYYRDANDTGHLGLARIPLMGGTPVRILDQDLSLISFSPNGRQFAAYTFNEDDRSQLIVAAPDGSDRRVVVTLDGARRFRGNPSWTPNGKGVVATVSEGAQNPGSPFEIDVLTGEMLRLVPRCVELTKVSVLRPLQNGGYITISGDDSQIWVLSDDLHSCRRLTDDPVAYGISAVAAANADASRLALTGLQDVFNLWEHSLSSGRPPRRLTRGVNTRDGRQGVAIFPDGRIVFTRNDSGTPGGKSDLWLLERDGSQQRLTDTADEESNPAASPDGRYVVYVRTEGNSSSLWRRDLDGEPIRVETGEVQPSNPAIAPDGSIYYLSPNQEGRPRIKRISSAGAVPEDVTPIDDCRRGLRLSPDATKVSCGTGDRIKAVSMSDGTILLDIAAPQRWSGLQWSPDSSTLYYVTQSVELTELWTLSLEGTHTKVLDITPENMSNWRIAPDGQSIIGSRGSMFLDAYVMTLE